MLHPRGSPSHDEGRCISLSNKEALCEGNGLSHRDSTYVYIYIYLERERERENTQIYIWHTIISSVEGLYEELAPLGNRAGCQDLRPRAPGPGARGLGPGPGAWARGPGPRVQSCRVIYTRVYAYVYMCVYIYIYICIYTYMYM